MDELEKLFAEASATVKRATAAPPKQEPAPKAEEAPGVETPAAPPPPPPPPASREPVKVTGGSRTDAGLELNGPTGTFPVEWSTVGSVALGRTDRGQALSFSAGGRLFYFEDAEVTYKGLVAPLEPTAPANWRGLVREFAERSGSAEDAGVQAVTQGGGAIPRYPSLDAFLGRS